MDAAAWLACLHPREMLRHRLPARPSGSKLRLWACACARRAWELLEGWARHVVELAERFADGAEDGRAMAAARQGAWLRIMDARGTTPEDYLAVACANESAERAAVAASAHSDRLVVCGLRAAAKARATGAASFRCAVGNTFRPVAVRPRLAGLERRSRGPADVPRAGLDLHLDKRPITPAD